MTQFLGLSALSDSLPQHILGFSSATFVVMKLCNLSFEPRWQETFTQQGFLRLWSKFSLKKASDVSGQFVFLIIFGRVEISVYPGEYNRSWGCAAHSSGSTRFCTASQPEQALRNGLRSGRWLSDVHMRSPPPMRGPAFGGYLKMPNRYKKWFLSIVRFPVYVDSMGLT